jgi:hypothetical protein
MNIYYYKNGEIAFYENNEKHLISKQEEKDLFSDDSYITKVINYFITNNRFKSQSMIEVVKFYREHNVKIENVNIKKQGFDFTITIAKIDGQIENIELVRNESKMASLYKDEEGFEKLKGLIIKQLKISL